MSDEYVLDASAILALLQSEAGSDIVLQALPSAIISTVNLAEVCSKFADYGMPSQEIASALSQFRDVTRPFDALQALNVGNLRGVTRHKGLSLGDRACLALAQATGRTALTADRAWADLRLDVAIKVIR